MQQIRDAPAAAASTFHPPQTLQVLRHPHYTISMPALLVFRSALFQTGSGRQPVPVVCRLSRPAAMLLHAETGRGKSRDSDCLRHSFPPTKVPEVRINDRQRPANMADLFRSRDPSKLSFPGAQGQLLVLFPSMSVTSSYHPM